MVVWFILLITSVTLIALKLEKLPVNGKITALCQVKYVSQVLYPSSQTTKMNFEKLLG